MAMNPKTPTHRRGRSEAKTPLTPSIISGVNAVTLTTPSRTGNGAQHGRHLSLSRPTAADTSNPFLVKSNSRARNGPSTTSRPSSPVKRATSSNAIAVTSQLTRQANSGVIRKGGVESRLNVVSYDYVPPPRSESSTKRSKSTPSIGRSSAAPDRFITSVEDVTATLEVMHLNPSTSSPGHTARLAAATGVPVNKRVLSYHEAPPQASQDPLLAAQRAAARPLYGRPGALPSSTGSVTNKSRKIATTPERVLDAPGMMDDFYLNLISWSCLNVVAVALGESTYVWRADTGEVSPLGEAPEGSYVSSVSFSNDGAFLGVGMGTGEVELWDIEAGQKLRTMNGHQAQIATLSWNGHVLSSGCGDGSIWHHDVRIARHKVMELIGHAGEVCGLEWRADGEMLASGGNDNVVNIWDGRLGDVGPDARGIAKWTKRNHTAAVKVTFFFLH
jgi:cell division cycle 20, cofactor of APC complex